jgi:hypothetical protein
VLIEVERRGRRAVRASREDVQAVGVEQAVSDERRHRGAGREGGVELDEGVGPEASALKLVGDEALDLVVGDPEEAGDIFFVLTDDVITQLEDIHVAHQRRRFAARRVHVKMGARRPDSSGHTIHASRRATQVLTSNSVLSER